MRSTRRRSRSATTVVQMITLAVRGRTTSRTAAAATAMPVRITESCEPTHSPTVPVVRPRSSPARRIPVAASTKAGGGGTRSPEPGARSHARISAIPMRRCQSRPADVPDDSVYGFVTDGIEIGLPPAAEAASDRVVCVAGGAESIAGATETGCQLLRYALDRSRSSAAAPRGRLRLGGGSSGEACIARRRPAR
jgi:hypothetical protein